MYQVTTKLAHGLYHSATVVDFNLDLKSFNNWGCKVSSSCKIVKDWKSKYPSNTEQMQAGIVHM